MIVDSQNAKTLAWEKMNGLLPVVVQDQFSGRVLMQGYMNLEALDKTLTTGQVTFYSRSKQRLWTKGETSGNYLALQELSCDCDKDCLLALATPKGPTCHLGSDSCWQDAAKPQLGFLAELEQVIASRKHADKDSSYTASLFARGIKRIAQKVGEEGVETALAATAGDMEELKNESADLLYHLLVLLQASELELSDVIDILQRRHQ